MDEIEDGGGEGIYRAMEEENGMPRLGAAAVRLGVRKWKDIIPDWQDMVSRPAFLPGYPNGLSCAPVIAALPSFALPVAWGGANRRTFIWQIALTDLGTKLMAKEDTVPGHDRHVSVGPSWAMSFQDFEAAVRATRPYWKKLAARGA